MKAEKLYGIALEEYRLSHDMYRDIYTKFSILLAFLGVLIGFAFGTSMKVYASIPVKPYKAHVLLYSLLMLTWLLPLMSALGLCLAGLRTKYRSVLDVKKDSDKQEKKQIKIPGIKRGGGHLKNEIMSECKVETLKKESFEVIKEPHNKRKNDLIT